MGIHIIPGREVHTFKTIDGIQEKQEGGVIHTTIIIAIDLVRVDLEVLVTIIILIKLNTINQI